MKTIFFRARVALDFLKLKPAALASFGDGTASKLGVAPFTTPIIPAATITTQTAQVHSALAAIASGGRTKLLTARLSAATNSLSLSLVANAHYVEDTAIVAAAGDPAKVATLVATTGYTLAKRTKGGPRKTGVVGSGASWVHLRAEKVAKVEGHLWRYGLTTAKGTPPTALITVFAIGIDVVFHDLPSGGVLAVQHAVVVAPSKAAAATTSLTPLPATLGKHAAFSYLQPNPYTWSDFTYVVVP